MTYKKREQYLAWILDTVDSILGDALGDDYCVDDYDETESEAEGLMFALEEYIEGRLADMDPTDVGISDRDFIEGSAYR